MTDSNSPLDANWTDDYPELENLIVMLIIGQYMIGFAILYVAINEHIQIPSWVGVLCFGFAFLTIFKVVYNE